MAKKLYVGNIAWTVSESELKDAFAKFGAVEEAVIITDRETGRSKGFGFVTLSSDEEANEAVEEMNGKDLGGRRLTVNEARPKEDRAPRTRRF